MIFNLGELFCGPGGLAWGATHADIRDPEWGIRHLWANDYDGDTCSTYRRNICPDDPGSVVCGDVRRLNLDDRRAFPNVDALAFGFPCNDFSQVGEQLGFDGHFGPLYSYGIRILRRNRRMADRPMWFLAENVGGLKSANEGHAFEVIQHDMTESGYRIYPHLYKFEEYGVPQARHRIIIVGIREDLPFEFRVPSPARYRTVTCRDALTRPPIPADAPNQELTRQSPVVVERLNHILPGQNAFTANLPPRLQLHVQGARISQIYKRLDPDRPAYTVTGSGGGGTHIYHWEEPRALTNRERARLQTFPDEVRKSDFFPKRPYRFTVTTDDDQVLSCVRAQDGDKAIETPQNNSELGRYFRKRLGLPLGSYITVDDMRRYGRMSVTFYKLAEDSFFMDFSAPATKRGTICRSIG